VLLAFNIAALLATLSFANVTQEGAAKRSLREGIAVLSEVDAYLDTHYTVLQDEATEGSEAEVTVDDFLVEVSFTRDEVLSSDRAEFRGLLLSRAAGRVYEDGTDVIRGEGAGGTGEISGAEALRSGLDFLRPHPHRVLTSLTLGLAGLAGVLSLALVLTSRSYAGLAGLGVAVFLASGALLIAAIAVRFAFRLAADSVDDGFVDEMLVLGQELTWAPIRNGIIFTAGGAILAALGTALAFESRGRRTA
jgi:hypothetical protein